MIKGGKGGANTLTGLNFEKTKDILSLFESMPDYSVENDVIGNKITYKSKVVARSYRKHDFYRFLETSSVRN